MKTKVACLLVVFSLITTLSMAQDKITVQAQNTDISNNLDLKAVATAFGESKDLQEFEKKLNDYDSQISNLDLNKDGQVDYLRVIEKTENGVHVVTIQAVLDKDVYQDVATIIVEKDQNDNPTVQVVGDPYVYGDNYIIEPGYAYDASIFSFFWGANYFLWNSPYYWGYYPSYYHRHSPYSLDRYYSNVYSRINHNQRYYYTNSIRNSTAVGLISSARRNDLGVRQPELSFRNRNVNVVNKRNFEFTRSGANMQTRTTNFQGTSTGSRPVRSYDNSQIRTQSYQNSTRTTNSNPNVRTNNGNGNSNIRTYTTPTNFQNRSVNSGNNQSRPTYNYTVPARTQQYNNNYQSQPNRQPVQVNVQRQQQQQQVVRQQNSNVQRSAPAPAPRVESNGGNRGSESNRR
jgi:hypothetical protein